jgi:hypothetical protein
VLEVSKFLDGTACFLTDRVLFFLSVFFILTRAFIFIVLVFVIIFFIIDWKFEAIVNNYGDWLDSKLFKGLLYLHG